MSQDRLLLFLISYNICQCQRACRLIRKYSSPDTVIVTIKIERADIAKYPSSQQRDYNLIDSPEISEACYNLAEWQQVIMKGTYIWQVRGSSSEGCWLQYEAIITMPLPILSNPGPRRISLHKQLISCHCRTDQPGFCWCALYNPMWDWDLYGFTWRELQSRLRNKHAGICCFFF